MKYPTVNPEYYILDRDSNQRSGEKTTPKVVIRQNSTFPDEDVEDPENPEDPVDPITDEYTDEPEDIKDTPPPGPKPNLTQGSKKKDSLIFTSVKTNRLIKKKH